MSNRPPPLRSTENLRGAPGETNLSKDELLRRLMAVIWEAHGQAFHGYEVVGMEKLPPPGEGAFLIYYHGTLPLDAYYFMARHIILRHRFVKLFSSCYCKQNFFKHSS